MRVAVVLCAEGNHTGAQAAVAADSLRRFGGRGSELPIYAFSPRNLPTDAAVASRLRSLDVEILDSTINLEYADNGYANKVFACAWAERELGFDRLVFTDSDSVFLSDVTPLLSPAFSTALAPVWAAGIGSTGASDPADQVWRTALREGTILPPVSLLTRITHELIRPYFNSGLVVSDVEVGLFSKWERVFVRLMKDQRLRRLLAGRDTDGPYFSPLAFIDQMSLAVAKFESNIPVHLLNDRFNSPLHYWLRLSASIQSHGPSAVVHGQHQGYLGVPSFVNACWGDEFSTQIEYLWLQDQVKFLPNPHLEWPPTFLQRFDDRYMRWRSDMSDLS